MPVNASTVVELDALLTKESFPDAAPLLWGTNLTVRETLLPAETVMGNVAPLKVNSELVVVAEEITTLEPTAFKLAAIVLLAPTVTLPRLALVGETVKVPAAVPVPDKGMDTVGLLALEITVKPPLTAPPTVGLKNTLNVTLSAGASVKGGLIPVRPNAEPVVFAEDSTTGAWPILVSVSASVAVLPTFTLPKLTLGRLAAIFPTTPQPLSDTETVGLDALLLNAIAPLMYPAALGVNLIVTVIPWPELSESGNAGPVTLYTTLLETALETLTLPGPLLLRVHNNVLVWPNTTLPKAMEEGFSVKVPARPVPDKGMDTVGLLALEITVRLPLTAPLTVGVKDTLNVTLAAGASVKGGLIPVRPNAEPVVFAEDSTTGAVPILVSVSASVAVLPTATLPKLTVGRLAAIFPTTPQPLSDTETVGLDALLLNAIAPLMYPAALGVNLIVTVAPWPELSESGNAGPVTLYATLLDTALETLTLPGPLLLRVHNNVLVWPNTTLPKAMEEGFSVKVAAVADWAKPVQTASQATTKKRQKGKCLQRNEGEVCMVPNPERSVHQRTGHGRAWDTQRFADLWNPEGHLFTIRIARSVKLAFFEKVLRRLFRYI